MSAQIPLLEVDPAAPREHEFYETPRWQLEALLRRIELPEYAHVLEPCAGNGAIALPLQHNYPLHVWMNDLVARRMDLDSEDDATKPGTWRYITERFEGIDAVITNLPFSLALPILEHALEFSPFVATILRRTWDEPTDERGPWLAAHPCSAQIVLPRHSYRGEGSDSVTSAWFIWERGSVSLVKQPFDVVTKSERDELIARFGAK